MTNKRSSYVAGSTVSQIAKMLFEGRHTKAEIEEATGTQGKSTFFVLLHCMRMKEGTKGAFGGPRNVTVTKTKTGGILCYASEDKRGYKVKIGGCA